MNELVFLDDIFWVWVSQKPGTLPFGLDIRFGRKKYLERGRSVKRTRGDLAFFGRWI